MKKQGKMLIKIPEHERRSFNYKPRYYRPVDASQEDRETMTEEERREAAMRDRIHHGLESQKKHHRVPSSRLWVYALILLVLILLMSRL